MSISVVYVLRDNPEEMSRKQLHGHKSGDLLDKRSVKFIWARCHFHLCLTPKRMNDISRGEHIMRD